MKLYDQQGNPIDVPDEHVGAALSSGQFGLPQGTKVPVKLADGRVGTVPVEGITGALGQGASVIPQQEYQQHQEQKQYGNDALHGAEAVGLGALNSLTLGASNAAAGAIGGKFGDAVEKIQKYNPGLTTAGELGSLAVPLLGEVGEGSTALRGAAELGEAADAASTANAAAHLGETAGNAMRAPLKLLGAPLRGVNEVGNAVQSGVAKLVGDEATSLAGKIAQKGAQLAARGAVEGAILSGGNEIGEEVLGDPELNGQKILAAVGHGSLLGLGGGAALGAAGELGSAALGRMSTKLAGAAEENAFRALDPTKKFAVLGEDLPGGVTGIGRRLLDDGVIEAGDTVEQIAPKVAAAKQAAGEKIGSILDQADQAGYDGPSLSNVVNDIRSSVLPRLESMPSLNAGAISRVRGVIGDLLAKAGYEGAAKTWVESGERTIFSRSARDAIATAAADDVGLPAAKVTPTFEIGLKESELSGGLSRERPIKIGLGGGGIEPFVSDAHAGVQGFTEEELARRLDGGELPIAFEIGGPARSGGRFTKGKGVSLADLDLADDEPAIGGAFGTRLRAGLSDVEQKEAPRATKIFEISKNEAATEKALRAAEKARNEEAFELLRNARYSFRDAQEIRARIDDAIKWSATAPGITNETQEALKGIRGAIEREIESAGDKASQKLGGTFLDDYKDAKLAYRQYAVANDAVESGTAGRLARRVLSPSDYGVGALAGHAAAGAHGGVLGGLGGLAASVGHHFVRERGNSVAAIALDKLSALGAVRRAAAAVDREVDRGVQRALGRTDRVAPTAKRVPGNFETKRDAIVRAAANPDAHADEVERAISPIADHAPLVAGAFQKAALRATAFLAQSLPQSPVNPLLPNARQGDVSEVEKERWESLYDVVHDPNNLLVNLHDGTLTRDQVEAVKKVNAPLYEEMYNKLRGELAEHHGDLTVPQLLAIGTFLGQTPDAALSPEFTALMQANYGSGAGPKTTKPQGGGHGVRSTPARKLDLVNPYKLTGDKEI